MTDDLAVAFPRGLLRAELFLGIVVGVNAAQARLNLSAAGNPSGSHFESARYGRGEVGELVLIEGQVDLVLARLTDVRVPETTRSAIGGPKADELLDASGFVQFLGTVRPDSLRVTAGVANYPRLGDRVYAAPHSFVARVPTLMDRTYDREVLSLRIGCVSGKSTSPVAVRPEKLFGRHCAVLGATGGGKSWTIARLLEEATQHACKVILLDATGEYRSLDQAHTTHVHLGDPVEKASNSAACQISPDSFQESDFLALFEPSGKVQGPKLQEAIRSLRLARLEPDLGENGCLRKVGREKAPVSAAMRRHASLLENPRTPFDVLKLAEQVGEECIFPDERGNQSRWGDRAMTDLTHVLPLRTRISGIVSSKAFAPVFGDKGMPLREVFETFLATPTQRILRLCLSGVSYEHRARQFLANAVGRLLLNWAREGAFRDSPLLVVVDEAHNFLGHKVGGEDSSVLLDAFELIAREGRKYGLNICLATQRPRDLTEGVLSQIGTLVVHRLTNDRDREIVERACGEADRSVTAFLANLREGEAVILGVDFPIPLTIQINPPLIKPRSDGPDYQRAWRHRDGAPSRQDETP